MAKYYKLNRVECLSIDEANNNLTANIYNKNWDIVYRDDIKDDLGREIKEIFGISSNFGGTSLLSLFMHGARAVPYFIKLKQIDENETEIIIISGGTETIWMTDWGRNKKVAHKIYKFCLKKLMI